MRTEFRLQPMSSLAWAGYAQRRSEAYADAYGIPSTYVYTMMSWLREEPMAEHVAVEFWSGSGRPLKCLRTLPLQFLKSLDG